VMSKSPVLVIFFVLLDLVLRRLLRLAFAVALAEISLSRWTLRAIVVENRSLSNLAGNSMLDMVDVAVAATNRLWKFQGRSGRHTSRAWELPQRQRWIRSIVAGFSVLSLGWVYSGGFVASSLLGYR